jgi:hypothetical protein
MRRFRMRHKSNCFTFQASAGSPFVLKCDLGDGKRPLTVFCGNSALSRNISAENASSPQFGS